MTQLQKRSMRSIALESSIALVILLCISFVGYSIHARARSPSETVCFQFNKTVEAR